MIHDSPRGRQGSIAFVLGIVSAVVFSAQAQPEALHQLLDEHFEAMVERSPVGLGSNRGDLRYNDRLPDASPDATKEWNSRLARTLDELNALDWSDFDEADRLNAELLKYDLALSLEGERFHHEQMPITAINGPQVWGAQMHTRVPLQTPAHYDDYATRLEKYPEYIDQLIEQMRMGLAAGRVPPRVAVEPAIDQCRAQAADGYRRDPTKSPFYEPFLTGGADEARARAARAIRDGIVPAFTRLGGFLEREYVPACRESVGASDGVDGVAAYEFALRQYTTLPLSADRVHQLGLSEVARLRAEMLEVIGRTDFSRRDELEGDELFTAFVEYLRTERRFYYDTPEELLAGYRDICKRIDAELPKLFGVLPRLPYGVREIPAYAAERSPMAYYYPGSMPAATPGYFMANTYALDQRPTYLMVPLTLHEAVPGHHLQIALARELEGVHPIRTVSGYTAFVEGWGLYAERLGLEAETDDDPDKGMYRDPYDDFGRLAFEMWRAMRLVVDTGIHAKGWTRDEAINYMLVNGGNTRHDVEAEIDRYIGWPGQATAYKIGELTIREIRERAESVLGERFDVRAFHDHVLGAGALPLPVLERRMNDWMTAQIGVN